MPATATAANCGRVCAMRVCSHECWSFATNQGGIACWAAGPWAYVQRSKIHQPQQGQGWGSTGIVDIVHPTTIDPARVIDLSRHCDFLIFYVPPITPLLSPPQPSISTGLLHDLVTLMAPASNAFRMIRKRRFTFRSI
jgi:hypothetical protein